MTTEELAESVRKSVPYVLGLRRKYGLAPCKAYPDGYAVLARKLIFLSIHSVPEKDIHALLTRERQLLELLNVDSVPGDPLWFEAMCTMKSGPTRLLLSGYDLGHPVMAPSIQTGLDFRDRERELFRSAEMGVDVLRELDRYRDALHGVRERIDRELPGVQAALKWTRHVISSK